MVRISLDQIEQNPQGFLQRVSAGESLLIVRQDTPLAEVRPLVPQPVALRPYGLCAGEFVVPDDFDEPLPEDVLQSFEGA